MIFVYFVLITDVGSFCLPLTTICVNKLKLINYKLLQLNHEHNYDNSSSQLIIFLCPTHTERQTYIYILIQLYLYDNYQISKLDNTMQVILCMLGSTH